MTINLKRLIKSIIIPLAVGGLAALISNNNLQVENEPPLLPPAWVFPVVWTILYILMGVASYLILESNSSQQEKSNALTVYGLQLVLNFFWPIIFFNLEQYLFAFIWIIALWVMILLTILKFRPISKTASNLMIPYLIWVTFAAYLNLAIYILN